MTRIQPLILALILCNQIAFANVEKVIFFGPGALQIPTEHPIMEALHVEALSLQRYSIRTALRAKFPTKPSPMGEATWILLEKLAEGQRYEVRICWAATQPTSFTLNAYNISEVFASTELVNSLSTYSQTLQARDQSLEIKTPGKSGRFEGSEYGPDGLESIILLQILAAADYYTTNRKLMEHVPPVLVDIILDPYLLNIVPQSLVPTGVYLLILAIAGWYLAKFVAKWLQMLGRMDQEKKVA